MEKVTIKLNATHSYLDQNNGEVFDTITVHEPMVQDVAALSEIGIDDYDSGVEILSRVCRVDPIVIRSLSVTEYRGLIHISQSWGK